MIKGGVGFFDSGIGGLTVLSACAHAMESVAYYYGDNARAPYGNLPPSVIRRYVEEAFLLFEQLEARAVVVACNTATAVCLEDLRARYAFPIIGTEPALLPASSCGGEVLVLATRATVESVRFATLLQRSSKNNPKTTYRVEACDGLAGAIEKGEPFERIKQRLPTCNPSAVVLGCTHYVYIRKEIENYYGVPVFDGNDGVARRLHSILSNDSIDHFSKNFTKSRDERPLFDFLPIFEGESTTYCHAENVQNSNGTNMNKCSQKCAKNAKKVSKMLDFSQIYFFGSGREINYKKYEQMFVVNKNSKWRKVEGKI